MKKILIVTLVLSFIMALSVPTLAISGSPPSPGEWTGNINAFLGMKYLDEGDWEPLDEQEEFGIKVDFKQQGWPVSIAIDYLSSSDDGTMLMYHPRFGTVPFNFEGETSELCFGVRKIWDYFPTMRPFIGGGIAFINAEIEGRALGKRLSVDDDAVGIWVNGGIYWTLAEHFNIGFDLRWSKAEVTLLGIKGEAGGTHAGVLVGYHW